MVFRARKYVSWAAIVLATLDDPPLVSSCLIFARSLSQKGSAIKTTGEGPRSQRRSSWESRAVVSSTTLKVRKREVDLVHQGL